MRLLLTITNDTINSLRDIIGKSKTESRQNHQQTQNCDQQERPSVITKPGKVKPNFASKVRSKNYLVY